MTTRLRCVSEKVRTRGKKMKVVVEEVEQIRKYVVG